MKVPELSQRSFCFLNRCVDSINENSNDSNIKNILHHVISNTNRIYDLDGYAKAIEAQELLMSNLNHIKNHKVSIPNTIHFIWFGELNHDHVNYMKIWENSNTESNIILWYDSTCFLSHEFHEVLKMHCKKKGEKDYESSLLKMQNEAYKFINNYSKVNLSFDEACIRFLVLNDLCNEYVIRGKLKNIRDNFDKNCNTMKKVDFRKFIDEENDNIKEIYELEMCLRGNLAAASDIARLVILREHGGLYIDIDTLPVFNEIFEKTFGYEVDNILGLCKIVDALKIEVVLSELYSRGLIPFESSKKVMDSRAYKQVSSYEREQLESLLCCMQSDVKKANVSNFFKSISTTKVYKNLATISTDKNVDGVFYSNVIGCEKNSKFINILIREMVKRYNYIKKKKCIFLDDITKIPNDGHFYSRFLEYRFDEFKNRSYVTIPLSGPGLLVEVMLGISYNILELDGLISPMFISTLLQNENMGIGYHTQSMHTPESLDSTWM